MTSKSKLHGGLERRAFSLAEFKALDETAGTFEGYLAVFSNVDEGGDSIEPGAFKKTLGDLETKQQAQNIPYILPIFWQHDPSEPIGGFIQAREDSHGLYVKGQLDLDIPQGLRAYSGMRRKYLTGMSIGYITVKQGFADGVRLLKEIRLLEGSIVSIPMNSEAQVVTVKDNQGATATAPEQRYVRPADHKARDFDTLFQSLAQADDLQDEWGDTFIAFTRAMWEMMCQASAVADGWVPPSGENQSFDAPAAAQSNLDAFSKAVMDLVTRSLAADFVPQLDYDGDQFLDPDGCNADDNEDAYAMMSASAADETKAGRVMSAANHDAMGKALDTMKQGLDAVKAQHKALSDMHAQMSPDANKPDASDDEPSDNDTQDAAGDSGKDTGKGGKSARTPQAGAGAGAASDDALDSSATPSGDDNNDEENAQRLALKIQANLLALRVRKGAA